MFEYLKEAKKYKIHNMQQDSGVCSFECNDKQYHGKCESEVRTVFLLNTAKCTWHIYDSDERCVLSFSADNPYSPINEKRLTKLFWKLDNPF